ncbi:MAG TPA: M3 family oligoendopeptidase [Anaerolineae bacterium]|nr:M3 family oligoendopeptidase [Anaerolineae bacterium]
MSLQPLPATIEPFMSWEWEEIKPYYLELQEQPLNAATIDLWLRDWSHLQNLLSERRARLSVDLTADTTDTKAEAAYNHFTANIRPHASQADQILKQRLLDSNLTPTGFEVPLRNMRAQAAIFRPENLSLQTEEDQLRSAYNKTIGAQTVVWDNQEQTLTQLRVSFYTPDRSQREAIWHAMSQRRLQDRQHLNEIWQKIFKLRLKMSQNASFDNYRQFRWQEMIRLDYSPETAQSFFDAIEKKVTPIVKQIYADKAQSAGLPTLRPWDVDADVYPLALPALRPFDDIATLDKIGAQVIHQVDPQLGHYFDTMRQENLLDLPNRKGKSPGAYCTTYAVTQRPFIFMNAVGIQADVKTLLHEAGHAFHVFERNHLPYSGQQHVTAEFAEVASMTMELLAAPYLAADQGGFYQDPADAIRARIQHIEKIILFWPYMAIVANFQHWAYTHGRDAIDPAACDAHWTQLWHRFLPGIDWSGFEDVLATGWHRKQHIFRYPFYYIEYGMAQLGAIQIWARSQQNKPAAINAYRQALALGGTKTLPDLYTAAGAQFAFDETTVGDAINLLTSTINTLQAQL